MHNIEKVQKSDFLNCPLALKELVDKYFKPHAAGFTQEIIDETFSVLSPHTIIVQVLNSKIYLSHLSNLAYPWHYSRLETVMGTLKTYIERLKTFCSANLGVRGALCLTDFEFALVTLQILD